MNYIKWLNGEIDRWRNLGIINDGQAGSIRNLYPVQKAERPWAMIVFSGIGAVIIGLGVILLFAYNWHAMTKFTKLAVVFGSIIISHGVGIFLFYRSERFQSLGEAFTVLGTMLFGAGIWLVAQIYHIDEHYPNAFLFWGLGAYAMAWGMRSITQGILAAVLFVIWSGAEGIEFSKAVHPAIPLILSLFVLAYIKRSKILLAIVAVSMFIALGILSGAYLRESVVFAILLSLAVIYTAAGIILREKSKFPQAGRVLHFLGFAAYIIILYILSFSEMAEELCKVRAKFNISQQVYIYLPPLIAIGGWVYILIRKLLKTNYDLFFMPAVLISTYFAMLFFKDDMSIMAAPIFNLVFLSHAVLMMARGCRGAELGSTLIGSILLIALVIARYTDLFESLIVRGLIFIVIGIILFLEGLFYVKSKKKLAEETQK